MLLKGTGKLPGEKLRSTQKHHTGKTNRKVSGNEEGVKYLARPELRGLADPSSSSPNGFRLESYTALFLDKRQPRSPGYTHRQGTFSGATSTLLSTQPINSEKTHSIITFLTLCDIKTMQLHNRHRQMHHENIHRNLQEQPLSNTTGQVCARKFAPPSVTPTK